MSKKFFKNLILIFCFATLATFLLPSEQKIYTPYDADYFEASPRIIFLTSEEANVNLDSYKRLNLHRVRIRPELKTREIASLNIIPKKGESLDLQLYYWGTGVVDGNLIPNRIFHGITDSLEIRFDIPYGPLLHYRIEYKESSESGWKTTPQFDIKSPLKQQDADFEVLILSDGHAPYDDADLGDFVLQDQDLRELRRNGDLINLLLGELLKNPAFVPTGELSHLMQSYYLASAIQLLKKDREVPDLILNLGDTCGGFGHKWTGLGFIDQLLATDNDIQNIEEILRLSMRKEFSAILSEMPMYWCKGNHDGEAGFYLRMLLWAKFFRLKYFKLPNNGSPSENYYYILRGDPSGNDKTSTLIVVLDVMSYNDNFPTKPEDWTLGQEQKAWLEKTLQTFQNVQWKFVVAHHVLGGWPAGSGEDDTSYAYGRGPLFALQDYQGLCQNPERVEQPWLTQLLLNNGVDAFIYGHDHIFHSEAMGINSKGKQMLGICAGSTKYGGEEQWWMGPYWKKFYGKEGKDFYGPPGICKLIITKDGAEIDYIRSAGGIGIGEIIARIKF